MEALILGCSASGKTLLVRQLREVATLRALATSRRGRRKAQERSKSPVSIDTRATIGVEIDTCGKTMLREVGAAMAPMWPAFFAACTALVFVIDASNAAQLPEAAIELWSILASPHIKTKPVLVVFSKVDIPCMITQEALKDYLRIEAIRSEHGASLRVVSANLLSRESCAPILDWIEATTNVAK